MKSVNVLDDIFGRAETHFLSTVHDADAVTLADPVEEGLCVVVLVFRKVEHLVKAEFVKGQKGLSVFVHALREVEHLKP